MCYSVEKGDNRTETKPLYKRTERDTEACPATPPTSSQTGRQAGGNVPDASQVQPL